MAELRWSKVSLSNLEDIISFIAKDSEENAKLFAARIEAPFKQCPKFHTLAELFQK